MKHVLTKLTLATVVGAVVVVAAAPAPASATREVFCDGSSSIVHIYYQGGLLCRGFDFTDGDPLNLVLNPIDNPDSLAAGFNEGVLRYGPPSSPNYYPFDLYELADLSWMPSITAVTVSVIADEQGNPTPVLEGAQP
ncbi:hypothetical protein [Jiangella alkaliphila]|uniref:Secreted protein n=1 Tax=Jiangella alkaliphila TaxID=419479 RepID=A0A1H2L742_9ACTN|nr:hypothetical protein [Jiangella alkaliphila]SDU76813.1 hypothetical protein SAMN04488563_5324 [Jiangella alkaliphila]